MDTGLPIPISQTRYGGSSHSRKRDRDPNPVDAADLDRAAQIGRHRYRDGLEIRVMHRLETEHFRYVGKVAGDPEKARRLRVEVTALSECAQMYLEGDGDYWRRSEIPVSDFGDYASRLEASLKGYWGPALSPRR